MQQFNLQNTANWGENEIVAKYRTCLMEHILNESPLGNFYKLD